eukprot:SAG22_NODE_880_length_6703_cov_8.753786_5_plen_235_part_00
MADTEPDAGAVAPAEEAAAAAGAGAAESAEAAGDAAEPADPSAAAADGAAAAAAGASAEGGDHPLLDAPLGGEAPPKTYAKGEHPGLDTALSMGGRTGSKGAGGGGGKKKKDMSAQFSAETGFRIVKQDPNAFVTGFDVYAEDELAKRKAREAKFGVVVPDGEAAAKAAAADEDDPRGGYDERKARAAKFGVPVRDDVMKWEAVEQTGLDKILKVRCAASEWRQKNALRRGSLR